MKTLTVTLSATPASLPAGAAPFAGFRLTLTRVATGAALSPPVSQELTWTFGNLVEGEQLTLRAESVDAAGNVIAAYTTLDITVPGTTQTYLHIGGVSLAWA